MPVSYEEWMSDSDALMWHIERDPILRSTVLSVWVLDRPPDPTRFGASLEQAIATIPRLRQRVVADGLGVATPRWEEDPLFDRDYHVRRIRVPGEGTLRDLLDVAIPIAGQAFDKDRPLWEFHLIEGLRDGKVAAIMKLHHAVSDGVGLVRMTRSLIERTREPEAPRTPPSGAAPPEHETTRSTEMEHLASAFQHRFQTAADRVRRVGESVGRGLSEAALHPVDAMGRVADTARSVGRMVAPSSEPLSPIWRDRSFSVRLDELSVSFEALRGAAKAAGGSLNDAFVAAVAGGLGRYHLTHDACPEELRMNMPINIRDEEDGDRAGNQFVPARFNVPLGVKDPVQRMKVISELVHAQRSEPALPLMDEVSGVINRLGVVAATSVVSGMMKSVDFVTSNVPGPRFPVYMGGARIERMIPFGPLAGAAVNVTLFSYDGQLQLGINSDRLAVKDPETLVACLDQGLEEVIAVA